VAKKKTSKKSKTSTSKSKKPIKKPAHKPASKKKAKGLTKKQKDLVKNSVIAVIAVVVVILILKWLSGMGASDSGIAARVGNEVITVDELNAEYERLPEDYQAFVSKRDYLENSMVPQKILSGMAQGVSDADVEKVYDAYMFGNNLTDDDLLELLEGQGISMEKFRELIRIQVYLNKTLSSSIEVTEEEIVEFYEYNKEFFVDENGEILSLDAMREDLKIMIHGRKLQQAAMVYVENIKNEVDVEILLENEIVEDEAEDDSTPVEAGEIKTFDATGDELCAEGGKPLVILFSTTWCPHCKWIGSTFERVVAEYAEEGLIAAYHWEIDINDDMMTDAVESAVNPEHMKLYQKYNPKGSIPTYVFGCKYSRVGNGYESQDDLEAEEAEFRAVIEELIA